MKLRQQWPGVNTDEVLPDSGMQLLDWLRIRNALTGLVKDEKSLVLFFKANSAKCINGADYSDRKYEKSRMKVCTLLHV